MILPDVNLLVYAYDRSSRFHARAKAWWEDCLSHPAAVALPWAVSLGFIRLMTSPRVFSSPMPVTDAVRHVGSWLDCPHVQILQPGPRHGALVFAYLKELGTGGNLSTDAHLAAMAQEYQAILHTSDADFTRFAGLRWVNPLV